MLPRNFEPALTALLLSGMMSSLISGVSLLRVNGFTPGFLQLWLTSWPIAWLMAFPIMLVVAPLARRIARQLTSER